MKIKDQLLKDIDGLGVDDILMVHNIVRSIKKKKLTPELNEPSIVYRQVRDILKKVDRPLADDVLINRADRI